MLNTVLQGFALLLQCVAAFLALRLVRITGKRTAWTLLALTIVLIMARHGVDYVGLLVGEFALLPPFEQLVESVLLLTTSILLVCGVYLIAPVFSSLRRSEAALRASEQRLRTVLQVLPVGVSIIDAGGCVVETNAVVSKIWGGAMPLALDADPRRECPGWRADTGELLGPDEWAAARAVRRGEATVGEVINIRRLDDTSGTILNSAVPLRDADGRVAGAVVVVQDITELQAMNRGLRVLSSVNEALIRAVTEEELIQQTCQIAVDVGGYRMVWIGFAEGDPDKTVRPVAYAGHEAGYLDAVRISWADTAWGQGPTGTAIRTGQPVSVPDIAAAGRYAPWREAALTRGYGSSIALPLAVNSQRIGALNFYRGERNAFAPEEIKLLTEVAGDLAYGIASLRTRTQRRQAEEALLAAERARAEMAERLGREISHRVKNNLAMVASLLHMQMGHRLAGEPERALMRDAITRIRTFAVLHEQTYQRQAEDVELIDALRRIAEIDKAALAAAEVEVSVVGEPVFFPFDAATNLSVVTNELITNAMKYGEPDATGRLRVTVRVTRRAGLLTVSVWNSGNPVKEDFRLEDITRGGLSLIKGVVDYYAGSLSMRPSRGGTLAEVAVEESRLRRA